MEQCYQKSPWAFNRNLETRRNYGVLFHCYLLPQNYPFRAHNFSLPPNWLTRPHMQKTYTLPTSRRLTLLGQTSCFNEGSGLRNGFYQLSSEVLLNVVGRRPCTRCRIGRNQGHISGPWRWHSAIMRSQWPWETSGETAKGRTTR